MYTEGAVFPYVLHSKPLTSRLEVVYTGKSSHAAGYPWEGVNALDAAVSCYTGLACLRQQCRPDWRIHCTYSSRKMRTEQKVTRTNFLQLCNLAFSILNMLLSFSHHFRRRIQGEHNTGTFKNARVSSCTT